MNFVNALFNSFTGAHASTVVSQTTTAVIAAAAVRSIWRRAIRRLARILTTTTLLVAAALLLCHPAANPLGIRLDHTPGPTNSSTVYQP